MRTVSTIIRKVRVLVDDDMKTKPTRGAWVAIWGSLALAALAGCGPARASEPPAQAPDDVLAPRREMQPTMVVSAGTSVDLLDRKGRESKGSGTRDTAAEPRGAPVDDLKKPLRSLDASRSTAFYEHSSEDEYPREPSSSPRPSFAFAQRRASEALDQLAGVVAIRHESRGEVITLRCDKLVGSGRWWLTLQGRAAIDEIARGLRYQEGHMIVVEAYTDSLGAPAANEALSLRQAEAVRDYLTTQGVPLEWLRAEGLGARRPVASNTTPEGRAENRRIEIVIGPWDYRLSAEIPASAGVVNSSARPRFRATYREVR